MSIEQYAKDTGEYTPESLNTIRLLNCLWCIAGGLEGYDSIVHDPENPESSPIQAALKYYRELDNQMADAYELIALEPPSEPLTRVRVAMHLCQLHVLEGLLLSTIDEETAQSEEEGVGFVSDLIKEAYDLGWLELKRAHAEYQVYSEVQQEGDQAIGCKDPITLTVAIKDYRVSRSTLMRHIDGGEITSHRDGKGNTAHLVSRKVIESKWPRAR